MADGIGVRLGRHDGSLFEPHPLRGWLSAAGSLQLGDVLLYPDYRRFSDGDEHRDRTRQRRHNVDDRSQPSAYRCDNSLSYPVGRDSLLPLDQRHTLAPHEPHGIRYGARHNLFTGLYPASERRCH